MEDLSRVEWDATFRGRGLFDTRALAALESAFGPPLPAEACWRPYYYQVYRGGRCVLRSVFTASRCKDDMLAPAAVSQLAEARRREDPDFLVSRIFCMGSLLSEGDHLFLDRRGPWKAALHLFLDAVLEDAEAEGAGTVVLGQLPHRDDEVTAELGSRGFVALPFPDAHDLDPGASHQAWTAGLSAKARRHQRREVEPYLARYRATTQSGSQLDDQSFEAFRSIYLRVRQRNLEINDFPLPLEFWRAIAASSREDPSGFEFLTLRNRAGELLAGGIGYRTGRSYVPTVLGLAGDAAEYPGLYRVALHQVVTRARELGVSRIRFGPGAGLEKRRFGARAIPLRIHVQFREPEKLADLGELMAQATSQG